MRVMSASIVVFLLAAPLVAQDPQAPLGRPAGEAVQPASPEVREREQQHVVRRGDTLWDLAGHYLANPFRWPTIHQANTRIVADPHWIYPEQVLTIPGLREQVEVWPDAARVAGPAAVAAPVPARTIFYREPAARRGDQPTILMDPMAARSPVGSAEFYRAEYLARSRSLPVVARVIRSLREMEPAANLLPSAHPHDDLYVSYVVPDAVAVGDRFVIAEVGRREPRAGSDMRVIDPRAVVRVLELDREVMRVNIEEQFGRVIRGHVLLPLEFYPDFLAPAAEPVAGGYDVTGRVLSFVDESPLPGLMARAFLDVGAGQGVQVGDIFEAYLEGRSASDRRGERVPAESVAELRVIRVNGATATVVVDEVWQPKLESGIPVRRVRKMP
jgi:hypothetical protein